VSRIFRVRESDYFSDGVIDLRIAFTYDGKGDKGTVPFYGCRICLAGTDTRVGTIGLRLNMNNEEFYYDGNIGYYISEEFRGNEFAVRGCMLASYIALIEGMKELIVSCDVENSSSIRVIEKLGAEIFETIDVPNEYLDEHDTCSKRNRYRWGLIKEN
jgi:predicted acetyltransferase